MRAHRSKDAKRRAPHCTGERERASERESVCTRGGERERKSICMCGRERERVYAGIGEREREREYPRVGGERERAL